MSRGKSRKKLKLLDSHQRSWVWGRNLVHEILVAGRWPVIELLLDEALPSPEREETERLAVKIGAPVRSESASRLIELCHATDHQGYLAKMAEFPYLSVEELLSSLQDLPRPPLLTLLDGVQDPFNFGAIVRSAEVFGLHAVCIGTHGQCQVNSLAARASAGAVNHVHIVRSDDPLEIAKELRDQGIRLLAATEKAHDPLPEVDLSGPLAIVLGNESRGIRREIIDQCDFQARIPQIGHVGSLNVSVAAGIVFYEASRQRSSI
ncbi:23S rRNA (guanosine(2251)-2'-O)-methyltransferase RlmB [bacterium]|nr:23S rRNA (guanosine(2251)-2'-O)-methyltransferase RlmB [bacterium]